MHSFFGGAHGACGSRTGETERRRALFLGQGVEVSHDEGEDMADLQRHVAGPQVGLQDVVAAGLADDGTQIGLAVHKDMPQDAVAFRAAVGAEGTLEAPEAGAVAALQVATALGAVDEADLRPSAAIGTGGVSAFPFGQTELGSGSGQPGKLLGKKVHGIGGQVVFLAPGGQGGPLASPPGISPLLIFCRFIL